MKVRTVQYLALLVVAAIVAISMFAIDRAKVPVPETFHSPDTNTCDLPDIIDYVVDDIATESVENSELYPLWHDEYVPLDGGSPPWPRGLNDRQCDIMGRAERIVIGRINSYSSRDETADRFHRHRVFGALEIREPAEVKRVADLLRAAVPGEGSGCMEYYPKYAIRIWGNDNVLDLLIEPQCGMFAMTDTELRYCRCGIGAFQFLEELVEEIPAQSPDLEHR